MKAVVLCGGKGTRLHPYTHSLPKPMLLLGRKPILEYIIRYLKSNDVREIVLTVGYLGNRIVEYFDNGKEFGVDIKYSWEEDELGTAGSVTRAISEDGFKSDFLVLMGDQLTNLNLKRFSDFHRKNGAIATIALKKYILPLQYGMVEHDKGYVSGFIEKPIIEKSVNAGIYAFSPEAIKFFPKKGDFAFDVFPALLKAKRKIAAYPFDDYWMDIGHLKDYESANETFSLMELVSKTK